MFKSISGSSIGARNIEKPIKSPELPPAIIVLTSLLNVTVIPFDSFGGVNNVVVWIEEKTINRK